MAHPYLSAAPVSDHADRPPSHWCFSSGHSFPSEFISCPRSLCDLANDRRGILSREENSLFFRETWNGRLFFLKIVSKPL